MKLTHLNKANISTLQELHRCVLKHKEKHHSERTVFDYITYNYSHGTEENAFWSIVILASKAPRLLTSLLLDYGLLASSDWDFPDPVIDYLILRKPRLLDRARKVFQSIETASQQSAEHAAQAIVKYSLFGCDKCGLITFHYLTVVNRCLPKLTVQKASKRVFVNWLERNGEHKW